MSIVICGIGCISSIGNNVLECLDSLNVNRSGIEKPSIIDTSINTFLGEVKLSNNELKKALMIDEAKVISRTALLGMVAAKQAINDSNINTSNRFAFVSSTTTGGMDLSENFYSEYILNDTKGRLRDIVGHSCNDTTNKIADYCNITGFKTTISTACSSSSNAIILGAQLIEAGIADYVVAGGTDALCKFTINGFNSLMILSKSPCKPFSNNRDGINLGEGAGYVVLCKEEFANKIYCKLTGYSNMNDAFHQTASSPNGEGAYLSMSNALKMANLRPSDINYINAHGTGTPNNDLTEGIAIQRVFGDNIPYFSSTKGYTGHTLAASGSIEAIFSILSLQNGILYKNIGFEEQVEELGFSPINNNTHSNNIKNIISNSFGFGGNCTSLILSL